MQTKRSKNVRLPNTIIPEHYELTFKPDLKKFVFDGEALITLRVTKPTKEIVLHAKELKIVSLALKENRKDTRAEKITFDEKSETVTFQFATPVKKGMAKLHIVFRGILNSRLRGFYPSRYMVKDKEEYLATTQFEPTDARCAFPCVDEPDRKAVFDVTLIVPKNHTAISNTLPVKTVTKGNLKTVRFAPTPKMSTYLLAFISGKLDYVETKTKEGIIVRVFATPDKIGQTTFALETCAKMLSFYNDYYGIPYPLKAMQLIAIPDFAAGAMENWGAVTYRESSLLIDEKHSSAGNRQRVAIVIGHELAHQWFGNLVTMEWWTHLWLNEGFASYMEYLATDKLFPEWDMWTQFAVHDLGVALRLDGLKTTHPIEIEVNHPDEINEIFDAVSYSKGASIINMLATYLGEEKFCDGLRYYLKKHQYGNARTEDLWSALGKISGKPVGKMMKNWTAKPGYPLITLEQAKSGAITATQRRFYSDAHIMKSSRDTTQWHIPLGLPPGENAKPPALMDGKRVILKGILVGTKFNQGESSVARVRYPVAWEPLLAKYIYEKKIPAVDRLGIVRDMFAFAEAGVASTTEALAFLRGYRNETDYTVWANLSTNIAQVGNLLFGTPHHDAYRNFARSIFVEIARKVGWKKHEGEKHTDFMLRSLAITNFGAYGDRETVRLAKEHFDRYVAKKADLDQDLRGTIFTLVGEHGDINAHKALLRLVRATSSQQEKERLAGGLESFRVPDLLQKTLQFGLSKDVRSQDAPFLIAGVGANPHGRELMWKFVQEHWEKFVKKYGQGGHLLPIFVRPLGGFHDLSHAKEVEQFFKKHEAPGAERTISQVLERIRSNADWLKRDEKKIAEFLTTFHSME